MRRSLVAAVALAPLCLAAARGTALAQDTITNGTSTAVATATDTNNGPGDLTIATGGSISLSSASANASGYTADVTLNSGNTVTNNGSINLTGVNTSAGVLVYGPNVFVSSTSGTPLAISNTGTITNSESYSVTTNSNGLSEAPFASPTSTGRYGILLLGNGSGGGGLAGDIINTGTISVQGSNNSTGLPSAGISIQAPLTAGNGAGGGITDTGTISYTGDNGYALQSTRTGTIAGAVQITGAITSHGTGSKAIDLEGDVGGAISIYSSVTSSGYSSTSRPSTTTSLQSVQSNADQVEQSGGAVFINGNVGKGIFIGSPPVGTTTTSTANLDGDAFADANEGVGTIVNYGRAPALAIGATSTFNAAGITIGEVGGTLDASNPAVKVGSTNNYGLIIEGSVSGQGVYDGVDATGVQVGSSLATAQTPVTIDGGIRIVGSVSADSFLANATGIHIYAASTVPEIRNEDFVETSVNTSAATGTNAAGMTNVSGVSTAIQIEAGANVPLITNFGTLQATAVGDSTKAVVIKDLSGSVTTINNQGVITAVVTPTTAGLVLDTGVGMVRNPLDAETAIDLSANTTGVTLTQIANSNPIPVGVSTTTSSSGVVTTTAALTTVTSTTTTTVTTTTAGVTTTTTTTTPTYPQIVGDVLLGKGSNTVAIIGGSVTGALDLGGMNSTSGASLTIGENDSGGVSAGIVTGPVTFEGKGLALNVANGTLLNTSPTTMNLSSLTVGAKGVLYAAIDPRGDANTLYAVQGAATLASGAQLGIVLNSPLQSTQTFTILTATTLSDGTGGQLASTAVPFLLTGTESSTANAISVTLSRKTAAQLGFNPAESAALNAVYTSLTNDSGIEAAVLGQYSQSALLGVYDQLLPDYAGGLFQLSLAASDAVTRATSRVNDIANPSGTRGAWAEEVAFGVNRNRDSTSAGYQGGGFGFVGGLEGGGAGFGAFGLTGSFLTGDIKDPHAPGETLQSFSEGEGGAYWQGQLGGFRADARVGAGYILYSDRRELLLRDALGNITLDRTAKGSSSGYTATGHIGLGYQTPQIGLFYFRPQVRGDYFRLQENGFAEHGGAASNGGDGFDLSLASKTGDETSGTASLVTGMAFGQSFQWRPELEVGYRNVFTGQAGDTTATFMNGMPFTLPADSIKGGGPMARLDVKADTDFYELNFEAGVEQRTHFEEGDLRISVRVLF